jgi:colicin import membrane protein
MIRAHENPLAMKAGALALMVHALFFLLLVMGFNWRSVPPLQVDDVELWDSLPAPAIPQPEPQPEPPKPEPVVEPAAKPEPPPPPPEPKAEIAVEKPKPKPKIEPRLEKKPKKEEAPKPDPRVKAQEEEKKQQEALRKLQEAMLNDDLAQDAQQEEAQRLKAERSAEDARKAAAASKGVIDEAVARITRKIYSRMNRQACGKAVPEYRISLLPTGELAGSPKLVTSSGIPACDDAAARAIIQAQPLPLPSDPELFQKIRDIDSIRFKPE